MNDLVILYLGLSPLSIVLSARAVAVARVLGQLPTISDLIKPDATLLAGEWDWLRVANKIFLVWFLLFLSAWLMGVAATEKTEEGVRGIILLTAFHFGILVQTLRAIRFNVQHRERRDAVTCENSRFLSSLPIFPGFRDRLSAAGSVSLLIALGLVALSAFAQEIVFFFSAG